MPASKCPAPDGALNLSLGISRDDRGMAKAIALARTQIAPVPVAEIVRVLLVSGCGLALVLAGPVLPI